MNRKNLLAAINKTLPLFLTVELKAIYTEVIAWKTDNKLSYSDITNIAVIDGVLQINNTPILRVAPKDKKPKGAYGCQFENKILERQGM